ncbi:MAG: nucleotidyl transferase AbiEii/AbiGii toxin family protein, partial [Planctomycetes bacterium]|nr:nucleotidyl transferase AbiEii/AbiGii toxin family protein [Planctomycetota bacterium]
FSVETAVNEELLKNEFNKVCSFVQDNTGIIFDKDRTRVEEKQRIDKKKKVYQGRIYFKDFYGKPDKLTLRILLDIAEFDKIYLPINTRNLIHPYSDMGSCTAQIKCIQLEEVLATKLKCLLQRRHSADLYDFVYSIFINKDIEVNTSQIVSVFLKKTIFEPSPGVVKNMLLELPLEAFRGIWHKYLICPVKSIIDFDVALNNFKEIIERLFGQFPVDYRAERFFPARLRNKIFDAGSSLRLLKVAYEDIERIVEPYSLAYKYCQGEGVSKEYFYVYDQTRNGIRTFLHQRIQSLEILDEKFEPRHEVEISRMGELGDKTHFGKPFGSSGSSLKGLIGRKRKPRRARKIFPSASGPTYLYECTVCGKTFRRKKQTSKLNKHKGENGYQCFGRTAYLRDINY